MFLKNASPPSLRNDLRTTRKSAFRTAFFVVLLISGIVPAFSMLFGTYDTQRFATGDHWSPLWHAVLHTYPLTLAIALITFSRKEQWFRWGKWFFAASVMISGATLSNSLSGFTGHEMISPSSTFGDYRNPLLAIPALGANYFIGFYNHYGASTFLAALLVGMFAGSTASRLKKHAPDDYRQSAKELVRELVAQHDQAA